MSLKESWLELVLVVALVLPSTAAIAVLPVQDYSADESSESDSEIQSTAYQTEVILSESGYIAGDEFCQCGRPTHRYAYPANGVAADPTYWSIENDIPWTATFVRKKEIFCTGVLLNTLYILTAGNCVHNVQPSEMQVVLNEDYLLPTNETISEMDKYWVTKIIVHPKYNESTRRHDIALIRLEEPINFFEKLLNPVCLPVKNALYYKKYNGTITKWAPLDTLDEKTKLGHQVTYQSKLTLPLISNQQCNTETAHKGMISDDMLCAGFLDNSETCKGDSGGPMTIKRSDRHHLVGIASWGDGCSVEYSPSIYTRVGRYISWILRNTKDAEWCAE